MTSTSTTRANYEILPLVRPDEVPQCAAMMSTTEPWTRLGMTPGRAENVLNDPVKEAFAARDANGVAGFVIIDMRGLLRGYINILCVRADCRGRGIGSALIARAEQRIFNDSPNAFICASSFNPGAGRLYQRLGYEVVGPLRNLFISGHDEILFRKTRGSWAEFQQQRAGNRRP
jgi:ribosomal protein S18 acetylase RimI-like enzyme